MPIKAIIFDLDDTLYDCSYTLTEPAQQRAIKAMVDQGLNSSIDEAMQQIPALRSAHQGKVNIVEALVEHFGPKRDGLVETGMDAYNAADILGDIALFPGALQTLQSLRKHHKLVLVTSGVTERQRNKIKKLGIEDLFDLIIIDDIREKLSKRERFLAVMANYSLSPRDVLVVGDRVFSEIKIGNQLGMVTVHMQHGHYAGLATSKEWEEPDFCIQDISDIPSVIARSDGSRPVRVVLIGGGTGMPALLTGLKSYNCELTSIVSVTDYGRSSGRLRREFGISPPGDIRNCLAALAAGNSKLAELLQHRFEGGNIEGHTMGNLLLLALTQLRGSFGVAVEEMAELLSTCGSVLPASLDNLHIQAELEDGTLLDNEQDIVVSHDGNPLHTRSPIKDVSLSQPATAYPPAVSAIEAADVIILGPGGLFTSVISNLLIPALKDAIGKSSAHLLYICNLVTQPGQTDEYSVSDHLKQIHRILGDRAVDEVIVSSQSISARLTEAMKQVNSKPVVCETKEIEKSGVRVNAEEIIQDIDEIPTLFEKIHLLRHEPEKLARCVMNSIDAAARTAQEKKVVSEGSKV